MNKTERGFAAAIILAIATVFCAAAYAADAETTEGATKQKKAPQIAVIDITRVYRSYAKADEFQKKLEELGKAFSEKEQGLAARIRQLEQEGASLSMGSPRRQEVRDELAGKQEELAQFRDEATRRLDEALRSGTLEVYEDLVKAVAEYAKAHAIDIVLKQQSFDPNQPSARDQSVRIGQGNVLYCAPEFDITEPVIAILNKSYEAQGKQPEKKD